MSDSLARPKAVYVSVIMMCLAGLAAALMIVPDKDTNALMRGLYLCGLIVFFQFVIRPVFHGNNIYRYIFLFVFVYQLKSMLTHLKELFAASDFARFAAYGVIDVYLAVMVGLLFLPSSNAWFRMSRKKLPCSSFRILTWNLQGKKVHWKLLENEVMDTQTGYPPDLICFQNVPISPDDPEGNRFVGSLPSCVLAGYHLQGPVIENDQAFVTLVRKEEHNGYPLFAEPPAPEPIHAKGALIGIKSLLRFQEFPGTSISICNFNVGDIPLDPILRKQDEKICLIAGMFVLDGQSEALPAMGVLDTKDFRLMRAECPAACASGMPSATGNFYYSAGSRSRDQRCELSGVDWREPKVSQPTG